MLLIKNSNINLIHHNNTDYANNGDRSINATLYRKLFCLKKPTI